MTQPTRRRVLLSLPFLVLALAVPACSDEGPAPSAGIGGVTLPAETLAFPVASAPPRTSSPGPLPPGGVTTTVAAASTSRPSGDPAATASSQTTLPGPTTTEVILALCDLNAVVTDIGEAEEGYSFADLRCDGAWGTVIAKAFNPAVSTDELIVLRASEGRWIVHDGGGSTTCTSAGVPPEVFQSLGCERWERRG